jgi:adenylate cyclase
MPPKLAYSQGSQALQKALDLDDMLPEAHALVGSLRAIEYDWKGADREFRRAMELNPQSVDIVESYDYFYLVPMGRLDEAIAGMRKALERDPLSPLLQFRLGLWYLYARQNDRAMEQFRNALDLDPNYYAAHAAIGKLQANSGKPDEAIRSAETIVKLTARSPFALGFLGSLYAGAGRVSEARKLLRELHELDPKTYVPPSSFASIHYGLGEIDKAFDWIEKAVDERDAWVLHLGVDPSLIPLRSHPRFKAVLRKMNLQP